MPTLNYRGLMERGAWEAAGVRLPGYDPGAVAERTANNPVWIHFSAGNLFRAYIASLQDRLLNEGFAEHGIIAVEAYDPEIIDRVLRPHDNLCIVVTLKPESGGGAAGGGAVTGNGVVGSGVAVCGGETAGASSAVGSGVVGSGVTGSGVAAGSGTAESSVETASGSAKAAGSDAVVGSNAVGSGVVGSGVVGSGVAGSGVAVNSGTAESSVETASGSAKAAGSDAVVGSNAVTNKGDTAGGGAARDFGVIIGSISRAYSAADAAGYEAVRRAFVYPGLQMVSFTVTEKAYSLRGADGEYLTDVAADIRGGPAHPANIMAIAAALLFERYKAGAYPIALVSMDNCSKNGERLRTAVMEIAAQWVEHGLCDYGFIGWLGDESRVAFPWSMIDKITPWPSEAIAKRLAGAGITDMAPAATKKGTVVAPFVNTEPAQYLVIEESFPNGRPALEKAGVIFTDRGTVNRAERMKVATCLNPLQTALAIFGFLLGYKTIADEMKDATLLTLVHNVAYDEGLPAVADPGVINPKAFIDEAVNERLPNPMLPDAPPRIATDTSQKIAIRFGGTIRYYMNNVDNSAVELSDVERGDVERKSINNDAMVRGDVERSDVKRSNVERSDEERGVTDSSAMDHGVEDSDAMVCGVTDCDVKEHGVVDRGATVRGAPQHLAITQPADLTGIPLVLAGWLRYLLAVDDNLKPFSPSPDPMLDVLRAKLSSIKIGVCGGGSSGSSAGGAYDETGIDVETDEVCEVIGGGAADATENMKKILEPILSDELLFGVDLYAAGLADKIIQMFSDMTKGAGAVRRTLEKYLLNENKSRGRPKAAPTHE